jgi:uncharacterized membrane protein YedE/YeeE
MVFEDFSMMKMFLSGTAVGMFSLSFLIYLELQKRAAIKLSLGLQLMRGYGANVVGGLIMGMGINLAGACPGTMLAQVGAGVPGSLFTLTGGLVGAALFSMLHTALRESRFHVKEEAVLIDEYFGMPIWKISAIFSAFVGIVVGVIEYLSPWSGTLSRHLFGGWSAPSFFLDPWAESWSPITAGIVMGLLQIPTFYVLDQNIAVSSSFVSVSGFFFRATVPNVFERMPYLKSFYGVGDYGQLGSGLGIVFGSFLSQYMSGVSVVHDSSLSFFRQFLGGLLVLFGARLAGGCASGHGLSGIARLSSASLLTAAMMFVGAIGSGLIARYLW